MENTIVLYSNEYRKLHSQDFDSVSELIIRQQGKCESMQKISVGGKLYNGKEIIRVH